MARKIKQIVCSNCTNKDCEIEVYVGEIVFCPNKEKTKKAVLEKNSIKTDTQNPLLINTI